MTSRRQLLQFVGAGALAHLAQRAGADQPAAKPKRLLFIHGRDQQGHDPKKLQAEWSAALALGAKTIGKAVPSHIDVAFPFYGDTLGKFEKETTIPLTSDVHSRGSVDDQKFLQFQHDVAEAIRQKEGISDDQVNAEYTGNPNKERGPLNWSWVQAILRAIDKHSHAMSEKALELFTRDVYLYCTLPGIQQAINRIVQKALTDEPTVIVAHSLGTVVAYSILTTDPRALKVPLFVTVGCPLGVRAIRDLFRPIQSPDTVNHWYNAFDTRDVVALYPLDKDNFPVDPAIENYAGVKNDTDNRHGISGYLKDSQVAANILDALATDGT
jgi:hypothetical protein